MRYYLVEITMTEGDEKEVPGIYMYDDLNKAVSVFHQKLGSMMKVETTLSELVIIFDIFFNYLEVLLI